MATSHGVLVERALATYYLGTNSGNGAGPVRYIDASSATLGLALGSLGGTDPVTSLVEACDSPATTARVLADGWNEAWPDSDSPGYLRFLLLTCAVVSLAGEADSREFGRTLAKLWGTDNLFQDRAALPRLWKKLTDWCSVRRSEGAPVREFILPAARRRGNLLNLGWTYEIAFPTWRDVQHLEVVLRRRPDLAAVCRDPFEAARQLCPHIALDRGFSEPMRIASSEFARLYEAKATLLRLHRFWGALSHVLGKEVGKSAEVQAPPSMVLRLGTGVDDAEATVRLGRTDSFASAQNGRAALEGPATIVIEGAGDWLSEHGPAAAASVLANALSSGAVALFEESFARWASTDDIFNHTGRCLLLRCDSRRKDLADIGRPLGKISPSWSLSGPLDGMAKASLLSRLGPMKSSLSDRASALRVFDGIRVGPAFLGRPDFLPKVAVSARGALSLLAGEGDVQNEVQLKPTGDGVFVLTSARAVEGEVTLRLEEALVPGVDALASERSVRLVLNAIEHPHLRQPSLPRWADIEELVVEASSNERNTTDLPSDNSSIVSMGEHMRDLSEAIYARGASGWSEADLVALVNKITGDEGPAPWDVLRALQEASWLHATAATTWRVRRWWLRHPALARTATGASFVGSAPDVLRRRFASTVNEAGGRVRDMGAPGKYNITPLVAEGVELDLLAAELRWPIALPVGQPRNRGPACWPITNQEPSRHEAVSAWSMSAGRFEPMGGQEPSQVELLRHRRAAGDRPDLFTVRSKHDQTLWVTLSRTAAVLEAYRRARLPMFEISGPWLVRLADDGYLPLPLAEAAVLRTGRVSGPYLDGLRWTYAYPLDEHLLRDVRLVLGDAIVRGGQSQESVSRWNRHSSSAIGRARARLGSQG